MTDVARPAPAADQFRQFRNRESGCLRTLHFSLQQRAEGYSAGRMTGFKEREGAHSEPCQTASAGVSGHVVRRNRRAGQDELSGSAPVVHGSPHMVPDVRLDLPLVNEAGDVAAQDRVGRGADHVPSVPVNVQPYLACSQVSGGGGLSAGLRSFDHHGAHGLEPFLEFLVDDSGEVVHEDSGIEISNG